MLKFDQDPGGQVLHAISQIITKFARFERKIKISTKRKEIIRTVTLVSMCEPQYINSEGSHCNNIRCSVRFVAGRQKLPVFHAVFMSFLLLYR